MTAPRQIEKLLSALIVLCVAFAAWLLPAMNLWWQPYASRAFMPVSAAITLMAMALLYEAAARERFSRGVYASVIFCSIPAVAIAATDPSAMSSATLLLFSSSAVFLSLRATGEERPFLLGMLALLMLAVGAVCGLRAAALGFVLPAILAAGDLRENWKTALGLIVLFGAGIIGGILFPLPKLDLPVTQMQWAPILLSLPWLLFAIPLLMRRRNADAGAPSWHRIGAAIAVAAVLAAVLEKRGSLSSTSAVLAPYLALMSADSLQSDFTRAAESKTRLAVTIPLGLTAAVLLWEVLVSPAWFVHELPYSKAQIAVASVLAVSAAWVALHRLPRAGLVVLTLSGIVLGYLATRRPALFEQELEIPPNVPWSFRLVVVAAAVSAAVLASLIRLRCRASRNRNPDQEYRFGADNFTVFSTRGSQPIALAETLKTPFTFVVFGDVTGAESMFATRRGGSFAFREFSRIVRKKSPAFAVSVGDLARQATPYAYRAVKRLLGKIKVPVIVSPGNHDLFIGTRYDAAQFHGLFGADNCAFDAGPLRMVILNNAWGFVGEPQFEWLNEVLSGKHPFTFVCCHKPVFELRSGPFYAMETREHADRLHELFRSRAVTAVLSGHIHSLLHDQRDGVTYIVSGGGGSKLTSPDDQYHYLTVDVAEHEITLRALSLERQASEKETPLLELHFLRPI